MAPRGPRTTLRITLPNGAQTLYTYDSLDRPTQITHSRGAALAGYTQTFDPTGRQISVAEESGRSVNYGYDALYRLTGETVAGDSAATANGSVAYTYDLVGNRLSCTSTLAAVLSATSGYDANDRLTSDAYDANGNTLSGNSFTYTYDFEDRLRSVNGGAVLFVYDGDGNRVAKTVGGVTTRYLVDDQNPTRYSQVVEEVVAGSVQRTYTYGERLISQSQQRNGAWEVSFYGHDAHGNARFLTDGNGVITDTYAYDAFGGLVSSSGSTPNSYFYNGEQFDRDSGLYYLRARYYEPQQGRFLTMDPAPGEVSRPGSLHKYLYTEADPVNNSDPSGLFAIEEVTIDTNVAARTSASANLLGIALVCSLNRDSFAVGGATELTADPCKLRFEDCKAQWEDDKDFCDRNYPPSRRKGRRWPTLNDKAAACENWADENFIRCKNGGQRQPWSDVKLGMRCANRIGVWPDRCHPNGEAAGELRLNLYDGHDRRVRQNHEESHREGWFRPVPADRALPGSGPHRRPCRGSRS